MTTNNVSINISRENVEGPCELKCAYNFKYPESNLTAKNNEVMISLTYDNGSVPPVIYNRQKYTVDSIMIVSPSIHLFNGATTNAEIIVKHTPSAGGSKFAVCVPIKESSDTSTATGLIAEILMGVANNAPAKGETTTLNISDFTLNNIIPKKPFYSYTGTHDSTEWIVYDILYAIPLNSKILNGLTQIIKPFPLPTPGNGLFYNSIGPNQKNLGDSGIYISCNPTGSSEEETDVTYSKNSTSYDLTSLFNNPAGAIVFQVLIAGIIFLFLFLLLNYGYSLLTSDVQKLPGFKIPGIKIPGIK
jgi:hypothetical protein